MFCVLVVRDDVAHVADGSHDSIARAPVRDGLVGGPLGGPGGDVLVEFVGVVDAVAVVGKPWVVDQLRAADDVGEILEDRLGRRRKSDVAVGRLVDVPRRGTGAVGAQSLGDCTLLVVRFHLAREHPEQ
nr:hypothetical protein [Halorientalis sp.]